MSLMVTKVVSTIFQETSSGADYILKIILNIATKAFRHAETSERKFPFNIVGTSVPVYYHLC